METTKVSKEFMKELKDLKLNIELRETYTGFTAGNIINVNKERYPTLFEYVDDWGTHSQGLENLYEISMQAIDPHIVYFEEEPEPKYIAQVYSRLYANINLEGVRILDSFSVTEYDVSYFDVKDALSEEDINYLSEKHGDGVVTLHKVN